MQRFLVLGISLPLVLGGLTRDYTGTPCVGEVISLTCTVPGAVLEWDLPGPTRDVQVDSAAVVPFQRDQYRINTAILNSTSSTISSSLSFPAAEGIIISCLPFGEPMLREELTILTATAPLPPTGLSNSILSSSANEVSVSVQWGLPTVAGGRDDLTYTVTISPPAQLSATVLTSTSVTVTAQYNVNYTVSVVATNCAGNSTPAAEYSFSIGSCPVLIKPMNGAFGPVSSRLPEATVTIQCVAGYISFVTMVTCESTLMWSPDPGVIECNELPTQTSSTTSPAMNCTATLSPPQNGTISSHSVPAIPGTQVTFQCDDGLFPKGIIPATCLVTGEWDKRNPGEIVCRNEPISCFVPGPPLHRVLLNTNSQNTTPTEGSVITFQCDPVSLVGAVTATCNNSGLWDPDPALLECISRSFQSLSLFTGEILSISVVVTASAFIVIGFLTGLLVRHLCSRKKAVYFPAAEGQANVGPTVPAGPVYEEVSPKEEIELKTNQAYGPLGL